MNLLIIGDGEHGKDELAKIICDEYNMTYESSSEAALRLFLFDKLRDKYGYDYESPIVAYEDRRSPGMRKIWYGEICEYNKADKTRLAREVLKGSDIYVGMRDRPEIDACLEQGVFDLVIGVYRPGYKKEGSDSTTIDVFEDSDIVFINKGSLDDLRANVLKTFDDGIMTHINQPLLKEN